MRLCKMTIDFLLKELKPLDHFSLVVFSTNVQVAIEAMKCTEGNKARAKAKLARIECEALTNLSGGVFEAIQVEAELVGNKQANDVRSVLVLTDGMANRGISDPEKLLETLRGVRAEERSKMTSLYCFGYGSDTNARLLRAMSESGVATGMGSYYFVESEDQIGSAFADALGGLLSVVAQNVHVKIEPINCEISKCISHPTSATEVLLGDFMSEEERDLLFEIQLPEMSEASSEDIPLFKVKVTYLSVLSATQESLESTKTVKRPLTIPEGSKSNTGLALQKARIHIANSIDQAQKLANLGRSYFCSLCNHSSRRPPQRPRHHHRSEDQAPRDLRPDRGPPPQNAPCRS